MGFVVVDERVCEGLGGGSGEDVEDREDRGWFCSDARDKLEGGFEVL